MAGTRQVLLKYSVYLGEKKYFVLEKRKYVFYLCILIVHSLFYDSMFVLLQSCIEHEAGWLRLYVLNINKHCQTCFGWKLELHMTE